MHINNSMQTMKSVHLSVLKSTGANT